ncbi:MAG: Fe-S cluster assembly protein SufD [Bacteroidaceae bacterium]|nr:Fe-S cluster assembly protein SufD [Bacteroidaceae bacterium]
MNHEKEYIEIFDRHRQLIEEPCARLLNIEREKAFIKFKALGFPKSNDEQYRHSNVAKLFATDFGMNLGRININASPAELFTCDVPNLNTRQEFLINDSYYKGGNNKKELPEGVLLGSLNDFAESSHELLAPYYNRLAGNGDSIAQFNTSFVQDGLLLYIPRGVEIEETIQIVTMLHSGIDMMSNRRLLIILGENAKANILICDHSSNNNKSLSTQVSEIFLADGAQLNLYEIEETDNNNARLAQLYVRQNSNSRFNHCNVTLTNGFTRNLTEVVLDGEGAETDISGLVINDKQQHTDNRTLVEHRTPRCNSNELYKYILDENSTAVFAGKMLIRPGAQQTNSQQTNRNLCLTSCARMYAQPQLEIYADDVKCSHGSTVGQLDENALFYMQQRGIPIEEARHLLMFAFAGEVIDKIAIDAIRDRLHMLVEKRFRGELNRCKGCTLCK